MKDHPLVSVVITCFNNSSYIERCIESVLNQTYPNIEIIVVNDHSTDNSLDLIMRYSSKIKVINNKINIGVSASRNRGYSATSGLYVTQLDGDDMFDFKKIELEMAYAQKFPDKIICSKTVFAPENADLSYCYRNNIDKKSFYNLKTRIIKYRIGFFGRDWLIPSKIKKMVLYDEKRSLYEDWKFKLQLIEVGDVIVIPSKGTFYRQVDNGLSSRPKSMHFNQQLGIFKELFPDDKWGLLIFKNIQLFRILKYKIMSMLTYIKK